MASDYFRVLADDDARRVRLVRSEKEFASPELIEAAFGAVERALVGIAADWALLIDAREGPRRNPPEFEEPLRRVRVRIVSRFARAAVLVKSAVGMLEFLRHAPKERGTPRLFGDEQEALAYLSGLSQTGAYGADD
jgi:hypothetical protein